MASPFSDNGLSLSFPSLCLVTDRRVCPTDELPHRVAAAVDGGVDIVQLRDKEMPGAALLDLADKLRETIAGRALLLINERADVALAARADGVQLGEAALPTRAVRSIMGDAGTIGRSVHSVAGACEAAESGADFLLVGTMFATSSHPGEEPSGPGLLTRITAAGVTIPLLGIGGITEHNAGQVISAGAHGVAVITSILASDDPRRAAQRLKDCMVDTVVQGPNSDRVSNTPNRV